MLSQTHSVAKTGKCNIQAHFQASTCLISANFGPEEARRPTRADRGYISPLGTMSQMHIANALDASQDEKLRPLVHSIHHKPEILIRKKIEKKRRVF